VLENINLLILQLKNFKLAPCLMYLLNVLISYNEPARLLPERKEKRIRGMMEPE
jgi:hypothetical protein